MTPLKILPILCVSILFIFQLGVLGVSLLTRRHFNVRKEYLLWVFSIALSCLGYVFSLTEIIFSGQLAKLSFLGTLAAVCFGASQALLILILQKLNGKSHSRNLSYAAIFIAVTYIILFEYGRIFEGFVFRGVLTSAFYITSGFLELYILWRLKRETNVALSRQLYIPVIAIFCNLLISFFRVFYLLNTSGKDLPIEIAFSITIFTVAQVFFTLIFIGISYYWVEELGISNRKLIAESKEVKALMMVKERTLNQLLLSQKSTMLGAYAHLVAHEINQPLATLQINADFLKELLLPKTDLVRERGLVDSMIVEILRAASIIRSIKGLLTQDKYGPSFFSLDALATDVVQTQRKKMLSSGIELNTSLNTAALILGDKDELQLVLMNLLENSFFAMTNSLKNSSSETYPHNQITLMTYFEGENVVLKVVDSGPGVNQEYRNNLFELHNTSKAGGTGMGLWLSSFIANRHNGTLTYDDSYLEGASFSLIFPRVHQQVGG